MFRTVIVLGVLALGLYWVCSRTVVGRWRADNHRRSDGGGCGAGTDTGSYDGGGFGDSGSGGHEGHGCGGHGCGGGGGDGGGGGGCGGGGD